MYLQKMGHITFFLRFILLAISISHLHEFIIFLLQLLDETGQDQLTMDDVIDHIKQSRGEK